MNEKRPSLLFFLVQFALCGYVEFIVREGQALYTDECR